MYVKRSDGSWTKGWIKEQAGPGHVLIEFDGLDKKGKLDRLGKLVPISTVVDWQNEKEMMYVPDGGYPKFADKLIEERTEIPVKRSDGSWAYGRVVERVSANRVLVKFSAADGGGSKLIPVSYILEWQVEKGDAVEGTEEDQL